MTSVAIIVLDTVRKDTFDRYFDWLPGTHFERAYSTSHWTVPAHASLYTGYYPSELGVHGKSPSLDCQEPVLAEQFHNAGYHTRLLSANPNIVYHDGWDRGFDEVETLRNMAVPDGVFDWPEFIKSSDDSGLSLYADGVKKSITGEGNTLRSLWFALQLKRRGGIDSLLPDDGAQITREYVREADFEGDQFMLLNLMEAHTPYNPPGEYNTAGGPVEAVFGQAVAGEVDNEDVVRQGYDDAVRYLADIYRDIFAELAEAFDYVVTVSDHGECLGEYDMWNHGYGLYPELVHVPLVISETGGESETRHEEGVVSFLDIHRTVCDLAGIETESRGENVLEAPRSRSTLTEYHGLLSWHYEQLQRYGVTDDEMEALEPPLDGIVDTEGRYGYETHESGFIGDAASDSLQKDLQAIREEVGPIVGEAESDELSAAVEAQLQDLGYK